MRLQGPKSSRQFESRLFLQPAAATPPEDSDCAHTEDFQRTSPRPQFSPRMRMHLRFPHWAAAPRPSIAFDRFHNQRSGGTCPLLRNANHHNQSRQPSQFGIAALAPTSTRRRRGAVGCLPGSDRDRVLPDAPLQAQKARPDHHECAQLFLWIMTLSYCAVQNPNAVTPTDSIRADHNRLKPNPPFG